MHELDRSIGRVWRRLRYQRFLTSLVWTLSASFLVAGAILLGLKLAQATLPGPSWLPLAVAAVVGVLGAGVSAFVSGASRLDSAVALDRSFHLDERVSTAWTLPEALRETPAGQALVDDAVKQAQGLEIGSRFGMRMPRRAWVPLLAVLVAVGSWWLPASLVGNLARAKAEPDLTDAEAAELAKNAEALSERIARTRSKLEEAEASETDALLEQIEAVAKEIAKAPEEKRQPAMVELNKLTDALKERQDQLGSTEQMARQLQQLKEMASDGPAESFAKELARGDFQEAADELGELRKKLTEGELSEADKKKLQDQLESMKKELEKLANLDERRKALEEAKKNGGLSQEQYEQEKAKLDAQAQDLQKLQQLAKQLGQTQQALAQGDMNKAAESLGMSQQQLQEMASQIQQLESMDQALADLIDAKRGEAGDDLNQLGEGMSGFNSMGGDRMGNNQGGNGRGQGQGDRDEAPDDVNAYDTKVPQQFGKGAAVVTGFAPPRDTTPGQSILAVQEEAEAAAEVAAEAMSNQKIPASVKRHVLDYMEQVRQGD